MYLMIRGSDNGICYLEAPEKPMITIVEDEDGLYTAFMTIKDNMAVTIDVGRKHQVHETVNKLLAKLGLEPEEL